MHNYTKLVASVRELNKGVGTERTDGLGPLNAKTLNSFLVRIMHIAPGIPNTIIILYKLLVKSLVQPCYIILYMTYNVKNTFIN